MIEIISTIKNDDLTKKDAIDFEKLNKLIDSASKLEDIRERHWDELIVTYIRTELVKPLNDLKQSIDNLRKSIDKEIA